MAEALRLPRMSDTMEEGVIAELFIQVGDSVNTGDVIAEVETDKATMEWEAFQEGKVLYIAVQSGDSVPVNALVAIIGKEGEDYQSLLQESSAEEKEEEAVVETSKEDPTDNTVEFEMSSSSTDERLKASPLAKKIAEEKGINLKDVKGSGDEGRIVKKDIEDFVPSASREVKVEEKAAVTEVSAPAVSLPVYVGEESYTEEKVSQMRKTIARRLSESKFQAPHFYLTIE
ncbi:MAG: E3 binding domain-containing protein, partial [Bacteroidetes bacterium]|nr:E3 binding domain-containing protein [Bacteroidota bacterium]